MITHSLKTPSTTTGVAAQIRDFRAGQSEHRKETMRSRVVRGDLRRLIRGIRALKREGALFAIMEAEDELKRLYAEIRGSADCLTRTSGAEARI